MPAAVVWAISAIGAALGGATGAFLVMYAAEVAVAAILAGGLAYSASAKRKAERMARAQYNAAQVDRLVNVATTVMPRELVLGRVRKGGAIFFRGATGTNNTKFVMCIALAGHEIDAVEGIYLNDVLVTLNGSGYVTSEPYQRTDLISVKETFTGNSITLANTPVSGAHVSVTIATVAPGGEFGSFEGTEAITFTLGGALVTTDATYSGITKTVQYQYQASESYVRITSYLGTAGQTADAGMITDFPTLWTSAHRARGVAYLKCEFLYDETAFPSGLPNVTAVIRGAKIYDPRDGFTDWTENPALMARHILVHPQFGKRASLTAAEDVRIAAAANACDAATVYTVGGVAQASRALYQASIVIPFGATARDALDDVVQAMAGQWAYAAGEFYLRAGSYSASVLTLTDADLAVVQRGPDGEVNQSPVQIITHRARDQMFNVVTPTIWDAAQDYKQSTLTPLKSSALITRDGAELVQDVSLPGVFYAPQAQHIAGVMMRDARDPLSVTLPFKLSAYRIELFDTVSLTLTRYGWSAKTFMVLGREWTHDGAIKLTLKENAASTYTIDADFSAQGGAANTALPDAWYVPAMGALTVTSGAGVWAVQADGTIISRVNVAWPAFTDQAVTLGGYVDVMYRPVNGPGTWKTVRVNGSETSVTITEDHLDGVHYVFVAIPRTPLAVGAAGAQVVHQVTPLPIGAKYAALWSADEAATNWAQWVGSGGVPAGVFPSSVLEAESAVTWSTAPVTWTAFTSWAASPVGSIVYAAAPMNFGVAISGQLVCDVAATGTVVVETRHSADGFTWSAWSSATSFMDVWAQARITVTHARPEVTRFRVTAFGPLRIESIHNVNPAALPTGYKLGTGYLMLPLPNDFTWIASAEVTYIEDTSPGTWYAQLLSTGRDVVGPNPLGPSFAFYRDGVLADPALIHFRIEGY